jgi:ectoine hydroxylase-related dioxygenase (phytanoyl-CoA dioxygenase family)
VASEDNQQVLNRIAEALERLAPAVARPVDLESGDAFLWDGRPLGTGGLSG